MFDPKATESRTIRLVVQYRGGKFAGWQVQPNARTVQGDIERAITEMTGETLRVYGSSRTDAGVHALGLSAHFVTMSALPLYRFVHGLNALLDDDVSVVSAQEAPAHFHARYSALGKHYQYRIWNGVVRSAHEADRSWHVPAPLDVDAMNAAGARLEGLHDFTSLVSRPQGDGDCRRRLNRVSACQPDPHTPVILIDVEGSSFLYKMVRTIAGTLVQVGKGKQQPDAIERILAAKERKEAGPTAPPQGLFLVRVFYNEDTLTRPRMGAATERSGA
ncbi:tRNA pseudouridine(38-40) synthase TruA [Planctomycetota bacterium]|nr:tRNA pseudouridine(38-40) synthase TruA [Planctomycetota bacterium]